MSLFKMLFDPSRLGQISKMSPCKLRNVRTLSYKADLPRHAYPHTQLQLEGRKPEEIKKSFRSLLELSIKWRVPSNHMSFMIKVLNKDDCKVVIEEKGTVKKLINDLILENIQLTTEEKDLFWRDYRRFIIQDMEESADPKSRRRVALELFRIVIAKGSTRVLEMSRTEVFTLVSKSPIGRVSRGWREKEGGYRLACVLAEMDALDVCSFATYHIANLMLGDRERVPILRAAGLKFLYVAARHDRISGDKLLFSMLKDNIGASSNVVNSYAAICVSVLLVKQEKERQNLVGACDISTVALTLLKTLDFEGSSDNEHLMTCLFHTIKVADISGDIATRCFPKLLKEIRTSHKNKLFYDHVSKSFNLLLYRLWEENTGFLEMAVCVSIRGGLLKEVVWLSKEKVSSVRDNKLGFFLLKSMIQELEYNEMKPYMTDLWAHMRRLIVNDEIDGFQESFLLLMSDFLVKHGVNRLVESLHSTSPNMLLDLLRLVWLPKMMTVTGVNEVIFLIVALTKLLCNTDFFAGDQEAETLWGQLLQNLLTVASDNHNDIFDAPEKPLFFMATSLLEVTSSKKHHGRFVEIMEETLDDTSKAYLIQLSALYESSRKPKP